MKPAVLNKAIFQIAMQTGNHYHSIMNILNDLEIICCQISAEKFAKKILKREITTRSWLYDLIWLDYDRLSFILLKCKLPFVESCVSKLLVEVESLLGLAQRVHPCILSGKTSPELGVYGPPGLVQAKILSDSGPVQFQKFKEFL